MSKETLINPNTYELEEHKWLKSIIPSDYLNIALEAAATSLNQQQLQNKATTSSAVPASSSLHNIHSNHTHMLTKTLSITNYTVNSPEVTESLVRDVSPQLAATLSDQFYKVLIVNINDKALECPGMVPEDKFLSDKRLVHENYYDISSSASSAASFFFRNKNKKSGSMQGASGATAAKGTHSGSGTLIKTTKSGKLVNSKSSKKHDSNNKEDEVRSRHDGSVDCESVSSNDEDDLGDESANRRHHGVEDEDDDEIEDEADHIRRVVVGDDEEDEDDGLSEFDNLSNRDTPIISGRDTPSSHSHDDLLNISSSRQHQHAHGQSGQNSTSVGPNQINSQLSSNAGAYVGAVGPNGQSLNQSNSSGMLHSNSAGVGRGPQLPMTAQKPNSEDINDKFCKFEINKSTL